MYDRSLGVTGPAFEEVAARSTELVAESAAIFDATMDAVGQEPCSIVMVTGDITHEGEAVSHDYAVRRFAELKAAGKKVFVVPGNHDLNNPNAVRYSNTETFPVPTITKAQFVQLYGPFGYDEATSRDEHSLSYVVQPADRLELLALDTGGEQPRLSAETLVWATAHVAEARRRGIRVLAIAHHSLVEHFDGNSLLFNDDVIDDWLTRASALEHAGLRLAFTGHQHVQDIARHELVDRLIDVSTGSPVGFPSVYRTATLDGTRTTIQLATKLLGDIAYDLKGQNLQTYSRDHFLAAIGPQLAGSLTGLGLSEGQIQALQPVLLPTILAYCQGDEPRRRTPEVDAALAALGDTESMVVGTLLNAIWDDDTPDNDVAINLENGIIVDRSGVVEPIDWPAVENSDTETDTIDAGHTPDATPPTAKRLTVQFPPRSPNGE